MKTDATKSSRLQLLQIVNDSQTPVDQGVLRILYKGDSSHLISAPPENIRKTETTGWDHAWFANYE